MRRVLVFAAETTDPASITAAIRWAAVTAVLAVAAVLAGALA